MIFLSAILVWVKHLARSDANSLKGRSNRGLGFLGVLGYWLVYSLAFALFVFPLVWTFKPSLAIGVSELQEIDKLNNDEGLLAKNHEGFVRAICATQVILQLSLIFWSLKRG